MTPGHTWRIEDDRFPVGPVDSAASRRQVTLWRRHDAGNAPPIHHVEDGYLEERARVGDTR